jgi:TolB-like protein/DNA-binding winged helix-turn-helix (wHTH) protein/Tfp pilus assembly protein PilF
MPLKTQPAATVRFGAFELDLRVGDLRKKGVRIKLQEQPFQVLAALLQHPGEVVTREELRSAIWPVDTFVDFDNGLNTAVNKLREALGDSADSPRFIETLPRRGYRFTAPVTTDAAGTDAVPAISETAVIPKVKPSWIRRSVGFGFALVAVFILLSSLYFYPRKAIDSIAVLPFVNRTGDPNVEYMNDGVTEGVINSLSQLPQLRVMARSTVFHYKGRDPDPQKVGQALKVQAVLTGTFIQHGDSVRIQAELVKVSDGSQIWGDQYDRKISDMPTVQQEIARDISAKLRLRLSREESNRLRRGTTQNPEAYDLYLRGRYYWNKRTPESFKKAAEYFTAATDKDPTYAQAWSGLADTYELMPHYGDVFPKEAYPRAEEAALRAVQLDDSLAEGHASLGAVKVDQWDWMGAEKEFRRAIELDSNYATAHHWYSVLLFVLGRQEEGFAEAKRAIELDPLSLSINSDLGASYMATGRFDEAIKQFRRTLEIEPRYAPAHFNLGWAYLAQHKYLEAFLEWKEGALDSGDDNWNVLTTFQRSGHLAALKSLAESEARASAYRYEAPSEIAFLYFAADEKERGFAWLEKACKERDGNLVVIRYSPFIAPYRSDPRYSDLLRRIGLPQPE